jgi:hypothetical protein
MRIVIAGHSRSKNGVASARLWTRQSIIPKISSSMDARVKPGHDNFM